MTTYTLNRYHATDDGTIGEISDEAGNIICYTCELPWQDNDSQISCIPPDTYNVIPHNSPAHPHVWEITGVPNRSGILIHNGNTEDDSQGCILVGDSETVIDGLPAVSNSQNTLKMLQSTLPGNFTLIIQNFNPFLT